MSLLCAAVCCVACTTHRHSVTNAASASHVDSVTTMSRMGEIATIVSDSIGVELIDIAVSMIDSVPRMTMKIARLSRNIANVTQSRDSVASVADVKIEEEQHAVSEQ